MGVQDSKCILSRSNLWPLYNVISFLLKMQSHGLPSSKSVWDHEDDFSKKNILIHKNELHVILNGHATCFLE